MDAEMTAARTRALRGDMAKERLWPPLVLGSLFVVAIAITWGRNPSGVVVSMDPGVPPVPLPMLIAPSVLTIAMVLLLPRGKERRVQKRRPRRLRTEATVLFGVTLVFPLLVPLLPRPEDYVLLKGALFLLGPCALLAFLARRDGPTITLSRPEVPWWVPLAPALVLGLGSAAVSMSSGGSDRWYPLIVLLVGAAATAITAGLGEELLYRRFLQPRLETLVGPVTALLATAVLFGLMHLFSHGDGPLWEGALEVIAVQGTIGVALGMIWTRWLRIWPCVLAHVLLNGLGVLLEVALRLL